MDDLLAQALLTEQIDDYVRGELGSAEEAELEAKIEGSKELRCRIEMARRVAVIFDHEEAAWITWPFLALVGALLIQVGAFFYLSIHGDAVSENAAALLGASFAATLLLAGSVAFRRWREKKERLQRLLERKVSATPQDAQSVDLP